MKKTFKIFLCLFITLTLPGCGKYYDKDYIQNSVSNYLEAENFVLSDEYVMSEDRDGCVDRIWTAAIPDSGVKFHIIDDFYPGDDNPSHIIDTDYSEALLYHNRHLLPQTEYLKIYSYKDSRGIYNGMIIGSFTDLDSLEKCWQELEKINDALRDINSNRFSITYRISYMYPMRRNTTRRDTRGDGHGSIGYGFGEIDLETIKDKFIKAAVYYKFDISGQFTDRRIEKALENYRAPLGIYRGRQTEEDDFRERNIEYYPGIIADLYGRGISFGSLYEVLKLEGFDVQGDAARYSFSAPDGSVYEMSYDFCDLAFQYEDYIENGYYYLHDGNPVMVEGYFYPCLTTEQIYEMTGLRLVDKLQPPVAF